MTEATWDLSRNVARSNFYLWSPPWPMLVVGLRFSRPMWINRISVCGGDVATDNLHLIRTHPEYGLCALTEEYEEWWAGPEREGFPLLIGQQITVELREPVYWAELLHRPLPRDAEPAVHPAPSPREDTRRRHIAECADVLKAPAPKRYPEFDGWSVPKGRR